MGYKNLKSNFSNPVIYESTTTTHTTTARTVKLNRGKYEDSKIEFINSSTGGINDKTELLQRLCKQSLSLTNKIVETGITPSAFQNGFFDNTDYILEDLDPKLGELLYTDQQPTTKKELESKTRWIVDAYGPIAEKSKNKEQLLQLIEYNKIEICENDGFLEQKTEIEITICRLMR